MPLHRTEICLVGRRPTWGNTRLCSILEALLSFKRKKHSWGWKAESEASENRTVVGRNNGCGKRVKDEEEEEGKGFADRVSRASIYTPRGFAVLPRRVFQKGSVIADSDRN